MICTLELGMYISIYRGKGGSSPPQIVIAHNDITDFSSQIAAKAISENANLNVSLRGHAHAS